MPGEEERRSLSQAVGLAIGGGKGTLALSRRGSVWVRLLGGMGKAEMDEGTGKGGGWGISLEDVVGGDGWGK